MREEYFFVPSFLFLFDSPCIRPVYSYALFAFLNYQKKKILNFTGALKLLDRTFFLLKKA